MKYAALAKERRNEEKKEQESTYANKVVRSKKRNTRMQEECRAKEWEKIERQEKRNREKKWKKERREGETEVGRRKEEINWKKEESKERGMKVEEQI